MELSANHRYTRKDAHKNSAQGNILDISKEIA